MEMRTQPHVRAPWSPVAAGSTPALRPLPHGSFSGPAALGANSSAYGDGAMDAYGLRLPPPSCQPPAHLRRSLSAERLDAVDPDRRPVHSLLSRRRRSCSTFDSQPAPSQPHRKPSGPLAARRQAPVKREYRELSEDGDDGDDEERGGTGAGPAPRAYRFRARPRVRYEEEKEEEDDRSSASQEEEEDEEGSASDSSEPCPPSHRPSRGRRQPDREESLPQKPIARGRQLYTLMVPTRHSNGRRGPPYPLEVTRPLPEDFRVPRRLPSPRPKQPHEKPVSLTELLPRLRLSLEVAAAELHCSSTTLKKWCRRYGINRWPSRYIAVFEKRTEDAAYVAAHSSEGGASEGIPRSSGVPPFGSGSGSGSGSAPSSTSSSPVAFPGFGRIPPNHVPIPVPVPIPIRIPQPYAPCSLPPPPRLPPSLPSSPSPSTSPVSSGYGSSPAPEGPFWIVTPECALLGIPFDFDAPREQLRLLHLRGGLPKPLPLPPPLPPHLARDDELPPIEVIANSLPPLPPGPPADFCGAAAEADRESVVDFGF